MELRQKRRCHRISDADAIEIVRSWHAREATQAALAKRYGVTGQTVHQLCHGLTRPKILEQVAALPGPTAEQLETWDRVVP
jgi:DNA-binding IclR family transcriptional regulator